MGEEELHRGNLPGLRRDAAERELDAVFQPRTAGVCKLAPRAYAEREIRIPDEVVPGETILELL
jgi:hypothetical protein